MTETIIKSANLFYREGSSDKVYQLSLEEANNGYVVNFAYGRRGNALTAGTKTNSPVALEAAEKVYNKLMSEKTAKGYVLDGEAKPFSGVDTADRVTGLIPQLLNPIDINDLEYYINHEDWMMQEKFDGKRIMVMVRDGVVTASNRKGLSVALPKETEQDLLKFKGLVIDGELIGSTYYIFDYLEYVLNPEGDIRDMRSWGAKERIEIEIPYGALPSEYVKFTKTAFTAQEKRDMVADFQLRDKEGVVIKNIHAPYTPGRPASGGNQLKCKFYSTCTTFVLKINDKRSMEVGVKNLEGFIVSVGNVTVPPNKEIPPLHSLVEVKYLYAYHQGSLYQPVYIGERDDIDSCDSEISLKYKPESED